MRRSSLGSRIARLLDAQVSIRWVVMMMVMMMMKKISERFDRVKRCTRSIGAAQTRSPLYFKLRG